MNIFKDFCVGFLKFFCMRDKGIREFWIKMIMFWDFDILCIELIYELKDN